MARKPHRILRAACVAACALGLGACDNASRQATTSDDAAAPAETTDMQFLADNAAWREQRLEGLLKPDGWTSLIGLHWIDLKTHYVGSGATNGLRLAMGPEKVGLLQRDGGRVFLTPERGVALTLDGAPLQGRTELKTDDGQAPSLVGFDDGKGQMTVIERGDRLALRVKHSEAPTRTQFAGLEYWPADPSWRIDARYEPHPPGKTLQIANIIGILEDTPNPGVVVFERDGKTHRLEALDGGEDSLFLILADRTSGHDSYGAGRYVYTDLPTADNKVVIDFNRAYNPPCAFTPFATCPLPPLENRLDLAVTAGEKTYAKAH
ncbi:DUF1684 domain-containing protein [Luteimonas vadosa]|uniref:DUF1684 domain-containing protein n=1 Tax=Luteimonas vadosa TaxID=1165507 RepID=A0ABP9DYZ3_9GAMM